MAVVISLRRRSNWLRKVDRPDTGGAFAVEEALENLENLENYWVIPG
jgi:hypothetical protein